MYQTRRTFLYAYVFISKSGKSQIKEAAHNFLRKECISRIKWPFCLIAIVVIRNVFEKDLAKLPNVEAAFECRFVISVLRLRFVLLVVFSVFFLFSFFIETLCIQANNIANGLKKAA
jgi:hypothetical protein